MDQMVLATQQWLNRTYGHDSRFNKVTENGMTGWPTIFGLTRALQIELGIRTTADNFGPSTQRLFEQRYPSGVQQQSSSDETTSNVYSIIQGALWCKGYGTGAGSITGHFYDGTGAAIQNLKSDMGIGGDSSVDVDIMRALLSMQQFVLLKQYGGSAFIRSAQRQINQHYRDYTGIIPTDGLYGREMNVALIQVLQALEGFTPAEATGNFGTGTTSRLVTVTKDNAGSYPDWVWLASVGLMCNDSFETITRQWIPTLADAIMTFQRQYVLPITGSIDTITWMSLLTSKGDPTRPCRACDTRFEVTDELLATLKSDGYQIVGRYLTEPGQNDLDPSQYFKAIRPGELERIIEGGMQFFPIFQDNSRQPSDFGTNVGTLHAYEAQKAAEDLGVPPTVIYFAVDFDATDDEIDGVILPYFKEVHNTLANGYGVGVYGTRNVCARVTEAGYAISSFVADMSTGFSGNLGFAIPSNWNYDQFTEIRGYHGQWDLDRVAFGDRVAGCMTVLKPPVPSAPDPDPESPDNDPLLVWTKATEQAYLQGSKGAYDAYAGFTGEFILEWLRKPEYWGTDYIGLWSLYTPEPDSPAELSGARQYCGIVCSKQPVIKGTLPRRDIAHMAVTILGYLNWGLNETPDQYALGDLGGWPLDLLQMWGIHYSKYSHENLAAWSAANVGSLTGDGGFGFADVLADADAWLIARHMIGDTSSTRLSNAMREVFSQSESNRIKRFYKERFNANADTVAKLFRKVSDGIDAWGFDNSPFTASMLEKAAGVNSLPSAADADTVARAYARFLENPTRR